MCQIMRVRKSDIPFFLVSNNVENDENDENINFPLRADFSFYGV